MARWKPAPDAPIGPNEHIGRRIFDEPKLFGAKDQKPFGGLSLTNFEETRDNEFSVDRMGLTSIDARVVKYLLLRAVFAGTTFHKPKRFDGWMYLPAKKLASAGGGYACEVIPSPVRGAPLNGADRPWSDDDQEQNLYHAHVAIPGDANLRFFALDIRERFIAGGCHQSPRELNLFQRARQLAVAGIAWLNSKV